MLGWTRSTFFPPPISRVCTPHDVCHGHRPLRRSRGDHCLCIRTDAHENRRRYCQRQSMGCRWSGSGFSRVVNRIFSYSWFDGPVWSRRFALRQRLKPGDQVYSIPMAAKMRRASFTPTFKRNEANPPGICAHRHRTGARCAAFLPTIRAGTICFRRRGPGQSRP